MTAQDPRHPMKRAWGPQAQPQIRLTDAERDEVIQVLQEAFSRGQLDEEELDERTDKAMRAKFGADLEPLVHDLGVTPSGARQATATGPFDRQEGKTGTGSHAALSSTPAERVVAAAGHAGNYFFPVLVPLLLFLVSDRVSPYVRRQAMESLNFQLFCIITGLASVFLFWLVLPLLVTVAVALGWAVLPAIAGIAALMGRNWRYPMFFRVLKDD